jgi:rhodanese-related sulfurtransferase
MVPEIDQNAFAARLAAGDAVVIDVRESHEFCPGHVPGARNLPLSVLPTRMAELPKHRPVYVICQSGRRSAHAVALMRAVGIDATNVAEGTGEWIRSGRTVETSDK